MDKEPRQDVANEPVDIDQDGDEGMVDTGILHERVVKDQDKKTAKEAKPAKEDG